MNPKFDPFDPAAWSGTPGCEAFEIALEVRARGALADGALPVLEAHLAACESCRQQAARTAGVDQVLAARPPVEPDWQKARTALEKRVQVYRRAPWLVTAACVATVAVLMGAQTLFGDPPARPWAGLPVFVVFGLSMLGLFRVVEWQARRELRGGDVVGAYRRELGKGLRGIAVFLPVTSLALLAAVVRGVWVSMRPLATPDARFDVFGAWFCAFFLVVSLVGQVRSRRRLRAALAELR